MATNNDFRTVGRAIAAVRMAEQNPFAQPMPARLQVLIDNQKRDQAARRACDAFIAWVLKFERGEYRP